MKLKNLIYFLLINIFVSAATTLAVLTFWDRSHVVESPETGSSNPNFVIPAPTQIPATAIPTPSLRTYKVDEGETLGEIALAHEISVEELLRINELVDPNSIVAGSVILVPDTNRDQADTRMTQESHDQNTNPKESASSMNTGQVEIASVIGAGDLGSERVHLRGLGEGTLSLTGWRIRDEDGNEYIFPQITLFGHGAVEVYSASGVDTVVALYWNRSEAVWNSGETATLVDNIGNAKAVYTVP